MLFEGLKRSPLRLEWNAERMAYEEAREVDRNQNIQGLMGHMQKYDLYQKCDGKPLKEF